MRGLLEALNPAQLEAVTHGGGPLLVLAGAGSGKTRVITHRIAHLILQLGVDPAEIVAVTFTNKAAGEMRERVLTLLHDRPEGGWIGTFHGLCLRILRRDGQRIGLTSGFNIYDTDDQLALVRRILRDDQGDDTVPTARPILSRISRAKNAMEEPAVLEARAHSPEGRLTAHVYALYEEALRRSNAVDFDDLLTRTLALFAKHPDVLDRYAGACKHLLVDEYQDTNRPQYLLVRALSSVHRNVCVVGDEDQSIYKFRGADIRNILEFERDHHGAHVVKLERNYRSTGAILGAAGAVISHNKDRKGKKLWTESSRGRSLSVFHAPDDRAEASWIARRVQELGSETSREGMAVLYRTNAQSRQIEEAFRRHRIPYQVVGAVQFYERKEVKDLLAYLKLLANPADDVSFRRVLSTPPRGIGGTTLKILEETAKAQGIPLKASAAFVLEQALVRQRPAAMLRAFLEFLDEHERLASEEPVVVLIDELIRTVHYEAYLERSYPGEAADRLENVRALVSAAVEFEKEVPEPTLLGFLDRSALVADADEVGAQPGVTLMTIHCAKGLEFPVVFLAGLEENLFPHSRSAVSAEDMEEERRLCYVAMTRAKERLLLSHASVRLQQGVPVENAPSRFLNEIPEELIEEEADPGPRRSIAERPAGSPRVSTWGGGSSAGRAARSGAFPAAPSTSRDVLDHGDGFSVGVSVMHPMFGTGRILGREGSGKTLKLTIHFVAYGAKKILPAYTTLESL